MGINKNDCPMFSGGMFGSVIITTLPVEYLELLTGDAFSVETGILVNAGNAISIDKIKISGGNATN